MFREVLYFCTSTIFAAHYISENPGLALVRRVRMFGKNYYEDYVNQWPSVVASLSEISPFLLRDP